MTKMLITFMPTTPASNENLPSSDESFHTFAIVLDYLLLIPVFAGNLLLIVCTIRSSHLQTRSYVMVANSAFGDLVFGTTVILFELILWYPLCDLNQNALADGYSILIRSGLSISLTNLLLITAERYLSVLFPFRYEMIVTTKTITGAILYSWLSNVSFSLLTVLPGNLNGDKSHQNESALNAYTTCICEISNRNNEPVSFSWFVYAFLEFALTCFFYISVVRVTLRHLKMIHPRKDSDPEVKYEMQKAKRRTIVLGLFIVIWLPFFAIKLCEQFCWGKEVINAISNYGSTIFKINYCVNFFVYSATKAYRKSFREILHLGSNSTNGFT